MVRRRKDQQSKNSKYANILGCAAGLTFKKKPKPFKVYESSNIHSINEFVNILSKKAENNLVFEFKANIAYKVPGFPNEVLIVKKIRESTGAQLVYVFVF